MVTTTAGITTGALEQMGGAGVTTVAAAEAGDRDGSAGFFEQGLVYNAFPAGSPGEDANGKDARMRAGKKIIDVPATGLTLAKVTGQAGAGCPPGTAGVDVPAGRQAERPEGTDADADRPSQSDQQLINPGRAIPSQRLDPRGRNPTSVRRACARHCAGTNDHEAEL